MKYIRTTAHPSQLTHGYLIALISAVILSLTAIFIRHLTQNYHMPALVLAFWRELFVVVTIFPVLSIFFPHLLRMERAHIGYLMVYGLILALFNSLWTLSVAMNGAAISTVLVYSSACFTTLLGWWFLKESINWGKIFAVILSLTGCILVSGAFTPAAWQSNALGILIGVISGLAYAIYTLMGRSASQRGLNPWTTLLYTFGFAAICMLTLNLLPLGLPGAASHPGELLWLGNDWSGWGWLFLLAAGPTVLGYGTYMVSLVYLPSSIANLIVTLEPTFTTTTAYFLLGERMSTAQITGSLMILGAMGFLRVYEGWSANRTETHSRKTINSASAG